MELKAKQENKIEEGFPGQQMIVLSPDRVLAIQQNPLGKTLHPTAVGHYPHAAFHQRERKTGCDQYILLYCTNGKGWIKIDEQEFTLTANTYFILCKNIPHSYGSSLREPWSIYWVHFTGSTADLLYERYTSELKSIPYDASLINVYHQVFHLLENDLGTREIDLLYVKLLQFLSSFIYFTSSEEEEEDRVANSISYMKNNLSKNISIKELAMMASYSISRYSELFRERTGYAPIQYFLQLKIQKSCQYLYFTKMTIKEICKEVGFDDQYYFSRMFRKQMNISPLQYRKQHKG
ncbi:AraC family transcriptional regulator [Desertivirga brevis]|uniref:AraC family transcriptional regulator n=1 Tax=Desertivirga brevis TaxID=2810310 RepID=UPI001A97A608|nr:AraC family transcriptional regulator [Pedobacter sp. SYSU D00873]